LENFIVAASILTFAAAIIAMRVQGLRQQQTQG
jgi:hypothetical protein